MLTTETADVQPSGGMTSHERCFIAWGLVALLSVLAAILTGAANMGQASENVGFIGALCWLAAGPAALVGTYYLIKAAIESALKNFDRTT